MTDGFDLKKLNKNILTEGLKSEVLNILQTTKGQYFTLEQITEHVKTKCNWVWDLRFMAWLAMEHGIKGLITNSIHVWRENGHIIISSAEKGKGYVYIDPNDINSPDFWDSKLRANESERERIPKSERKTDEELFRETYRKCEKPEVKQKLEQVAITHKIKKEEK